MKKVVITANKKTGEVNIEAFGYTGSTCAEVVDILRKALGEEVAEDLKPEFYMGNEIEEEDKICFKPFCG